MASLLAAGPLLRLKCHYRSPLAPTCFELVLEPVLHPLEYQKHVPSNSKCALANTQKVQLHQEEIL